MKFTPAEINLIRLNTGIAQAAYRRQESQAERLARVEARRFLKDPQPLTGFATLDPFQTDERAAEAME